MADKAKQLAASNSITDALRWRMLGQKEAFEICAWTIELLSKTVGAPNLDATDMAQSYRAQLEVAEALAKNRNNDPEVEQLKAEIARLKQQNAKEHTSQE
jgi:hypothetical protein